MDISSLFNPASIAIVGASREKHKIGHLVAKNLIDKGYKGKIFLVNNKFQGKILGYEVYPTLSDIKETIDLVAFAIPVSALFPVIHEAARLGIKNAVIYAAGFKETGKEGIILEKTLKERAAAHKMNLLGPNCIGYVATKNCVNLTFLKNIVPAGNIGFISQSGAIGAALTDYFLAHKNLGFSYFISLGNKTVIDETDCLEFLAKDKNTEVIAMYLEDVRDGERFKTTLARVTREKPVIIIKSGRTKEGGQAAVSHTGGMIGDDAVYSAVFKQYGAIRADDYSEFLTLLKIFSYRKLPLSSSILVLSNAGGAGVMLTDKIIGNKLSLKTISQALKDEISGSFEGIKKITVHNPIDLLGDASAFDYEKVIKTTIGEKEIGAIIVLLTPQANTQIKETAEVLAKMQSRFKEPIYPIFMGKKSMTGIGRLFEEKKIVGFANFDYLTSAIKKIIDYQKYLSRTNTVFEPKIKAGLSKNASPDLFQSLNIIKGLGIETADFHKAESIDNVSTISKKLSFPVVVKVSSAKIIHKTEVGGVITNIKTEEELKENYKKMSEISKTVVVQEMIKGHELILGVKRDPKFGVVAGLGLGGIYTELLKEISFRIYPFSFEEFTQMVEETRIATLLKGFRGKKPIDEKKIYEILCQLAAFMEKEKEIKETEINPLIVSSSQIVAVDARIITNR